MIDLYAILKAYTIISGQITGTGNGQMHSAKKLYQVEFNANKSVFTNIPKNWKKGIILFPNRVANIGDAILFQIQNASFVAQKFPDVLYSVTIIYDND